ncbi:RNA-binding protein [Azospirillum sp. C340-1]|uniref:RNA-binding protein n=1 Tax=Azospirillum isscasi TaxID=3053926 RepID=A0ABU0WPW0_9PROT|nr:RNA-binding protein [Azospirillum isscasi]MDQ2106281.1 RNA-binding protein [Azospirillum isscasi]
MVGLSDRNEQTGADGQPDGLGAEGEPLLPADLEKGPLRRCIATGTVQPKDGMIRFVVSPDGEIVPDLEEGLPGRGLWLSGDKAAFAKAVAKNMFAKAARRAVRVPPDLAERLEKLLERRCLDAFGLARRAGQALAGYEKVREALKTNQVGHAGPPGLLVEASDGSPDQRGKITALAPGMPVVDLFDAAAMAAALGRENAVHAVVARGKLAKGLARDAARLKGIKGFVAGTSPAGHGSNV